MQALAACNFHFYSPAGSSQCAEGAGSGGCHPSSRANFPPKGLRTACVTSMSRVMVIEVMVTQSGEPGLYQRRAWPFSLTIYIFFYADRVFRRFSGLTGICCSVNELPILENASEGYKHLHSYWPTKKANKI